MPGRHLDPGLSTPRWSKPTKPPDRADFHLGANNPAGLRECLFPTQSSHRQCGQTIHRFPTATPLRGKTAGEASRPRAAGDRPPVVLRSRRTPPTSWQDRRQRAFRFEVREKRLPRIETEIGPGFEVEEDGLVADLASDHLFWDLQTRGAGRASSGFPLWSPVIIRLRKRHSLRLGNDVSRRSPRTGSRTFNTGEKHSPQPASDSLKQPSRFRGAPKRFHARALMSHQHVFHKDGSVR